MKRERQEEEEQGGGVKEETRVGIEKEPSTGAAKHRRSSSPSSSISSRSSSPGSSSFSSSTRSSSSDAGGRRRSPPRVAIPQPPVAYHSPTRGAVPKPPPARERFGIPDGWPDLDVDAPLRVVYDPPAGKETAVQGKGKGRNEGGSLMMASSSTTLTGSEKVADGATGAAATAQSHLDGAVESNDHQMVMDTTVSDPSATTGTHVIPVEKPKGEEEEKEEGKEGKKDQEDLGAAADKHDECGEGEGGPQAPDPEGYAWFPIDPLPFPPASRVPVAVVRANTHPCGIPDGPYIRPRPYHVHIDETEADLDERVEYDLDSEDERWLASYNASASSSAGGGKAMTEAEMERMMDRMTKAHFKIDIAKPKARPTVAELEDDCCRVCGRGDSEDVNLIVFCDSCNVAVHQDCYGVRFIPEGRWLCRTCEAGVRAPKCVLCPNTSGPYKRTDDGKWAHVVCALWVPEAAFASDQLMEPVLAAHVPRDRFRLTCVVCGLKRGAPIQCEQERCVTAYHATCAMSPEGAGRGIALDLATRRSYCKRHASMLPGNAHPLGAGSPGRPTGH